MTHRPTLSRRPIAVLVAALATIAAGTALVAPAASADPGHEAGSHAYGPKLKGRYLALGDSVAFGYQPAAVAGPATWADADNFVGYPEVLGTNNRLAVTNASCPGETSGSMIDVDAQSNGCSNSVGSPVGYRDSFPLHTTYTGSQLDYAVDFLRSHRATKLVTLDIGANDVFVCQSTTPDQCLGTSFPAVVAQVSANVDTILSTLREEGRYRRDLVLLTYYSTDYSDPTTTGAIAALNTALAQVAAANGARVADGFTAFAQASAASGGSPCAAGLLIPLPTGGCDVHPTLAGHEVLAGAVERAVDTVAVPGRLWPATGL